MNFSISPRILSNLLPISPGIRRLLSSSSLEFQSPLLPPFTPLISMRRVYRTDRESRPICACLSFLPSFRVPPICIYIYIYAIFVHKHRGKFSSREERLLSSFRIWRAKILKKKARIEFELFAVVLLTETEICRWIIHSCAAWRREGTEVKKLAKKLWMEGSFRADL